MMILAKAIATCLGIGYIEKGAGTLSALFYCLLWYLIGISYLHLGIQLLIILILFCAGVVVSNMLEKEWGHDSNKIVIDEVLGMSIGLFLVPLDLRYVLLAFILFRFFDIVKPFYIRKAESFAKGWGVMLDDFLAGIYTSVILHIVIKSHLF
jgi:phosphatidylglycerophosphatase A